jgi:hypothetical protein
MLVLNANTLFYWEFICRAKTKPSGLREWSEAVDNAEQQERLVQLRKTRPTSTRPSANRTLVGVPLVSKDYKWKGGKSQESSSIFKDLDINEEEWKIRIKEEPGSELKADPPKLRSLASLSRFSDVQQHSSCAVTRGISRSRKDLVQTTSSSCQTAMTTNLKAGPGGRMLTFPWGAGGITPSDENTLRRSLSSWPATRTPGSSVMKMLSWPCRRFGIKSFSTAVTQISSTTWY